MQINKLEVPNKSYIDMNAVESTHWWFVALRNLLTYYVDFIKPKKLLDAGCGTGINLETLVKRGYTGFGIDLSELAINYSKQKGLQNLAIGSVTALPYSNEEFDFIYSFDVLGCLNSEDAKTALMEFHRCLVPGGYLLLNLAALSWLKSEHDTSWALVKRYSKQELIELLDGSSFSIEKASYRYFFVFPAVAGLRLLSRVFPNTGGDLTKTSPLLNMLLSPVMTLENLLLRFINFPIGSSVFIVAKKIK